MSFNVTLDRITFSEEIYSIIDFFEITQRVPISDAKISFFLILSKIWFGERCDNSDACASVRAPGYVQYFSVSQNLKAAKQAGFKQGLEFFCALLLPELNSPDGSPKQFGLAFKLFCTCSAVSLPIRYLHVFEFRISQGIYPLSKRYFSFRQLICRIIFN